MADFNDPRADYNPYAPPAPFADAPPYAQSEGEEDEQILAERGTRFVARMADGMLILAAMIPAGIAFFSTRGVPGPGSRGSALTENLAFPLLLLVVPLVLCIYQWNLIATRGQTLGKKWMGIRIVKVDGTPLNFVSGVILRNWVVAGIGNVPYLGGIFSLVDIVSIFGQERRCLHDQIAGTKVVLAPPSA